MKREKSPPQKNTRRRAQLENDWGYCVNVEQLRERVFRSGTMERWPSKAKLCRSTTRRRSCNKQVISRKMREEEALRTSNKFTHPRKPSRDAGCAKKVKHLGYDVRASQNVLPLFGLQVQVRGSLTLTPDSNPPTKIRPTALR